MKCSYFLQMKKLIIIFAFFGICSSCEDVIDVDLNTTKPRLVIDAKVNLFENGEASTIVRLTTTAPFFENNIPYITDAVVTIKDDNGTIYPFTHAPEGIYTTELIPQDGVNYTITVNYQDEVYSATEQLQRGSSLEYVEQKNDGGFTGEDIELKVFFTDSLGKGNYYFFEGLAEKGDVLDVFNDDFFDGNTIFGYYLVEDLAPGDAVQFNLYGLNKEFYNFMFILLQQSGNQGGGPFETQPATVRGNIVNETNPDNFPLGYFRISEVSTLNYTVQ